MKQIKIVKLKEVENPTHPNNMPEGFERIGNMFAPPTIGERFHLSYSFSTSPVIEVIDESTFRTLNSIYKIVELPPLEETISRYLPAEGDIIERSVVCCEDLDGLFRVRSFFTDDEGTQKAVMTNREFTTVYSPFNQVSDLSKLRLMVYQEPKEV